MMISEQIISCMDYHVRGMLERSALSWPEGLTITIEHPHNLEHGDYSTNIALLLAKVCRKSPLLIADKFKQKLQEDGCARGLFYKIEVVTPGFINLFIDWKVWAQRTFDVPQLAETAASKVVIEHTSINPNKSAHIGHLRNSCIGDTLARMLRRTGYRVEVHNYIDDLGNQLADTIVGILHTSTEQEYKRFGDFCWETYAKVNQAFKEKPELLQERTVVLHELEKGHSNLAWLGQLAAERIVQEHLEEMSAFSIAYDVLIWESRIVREGFWAATWELLKQTPVFQQEQEGKLAGCWVLKPTDGSTSDTESEFQTDKVLVRSNGILTYTAKDIAYHLWKFGILDQDFVYKKWTDTLWSTTVSGVSQAFGHADRVINVIDQRQEYPQLMVNQALVALGYVKQASQLRHVGYEVVSLSADTASLLGLDTTDGRKSYAMSGRQGIGIKVNDFLDRMEHVIEAKGGEKAEAEISSRAIAAASIRYYLLRFHLQTEIVFDLQQATEVSGNTGVYLLYSYARACSILDKSLNDEILGFPQKLPPVELAQQEYRLLRQIAYWPETLYAAVQELSPNAVCGYVFELSSLFNHFYTCCPILKESGDKRMFRLWLTEKYRDTLRDGLEILGLPTPNRM